MRLKYRVNFVGLGVLSVVAMAITVCGVMAIDSLTYDLNRKLLSTEVSNIVERIRDARNVLADSGVAGVKGYVDKAQEDLIAQFGAHSPDRFGRLAIVSMPSTPVFLEEGGSGESLDPDCLQVMSLQGSGMRECAYRDTRGFFFFKTFPEWNWLIVLSVTKGEMYAMRDTFVRTALFILALSLLAGGAIFIRLAGGVVEPIQELSSAVRKLGAGGGDSLAPISGGGDEVEELSSAFSEMSARLSGAYHDLERQTEVLRQANENLNSEVARRACVEQDLLQARNAFQDILDSMPSVVIGVDEAARVTHWNHTAAALTGLDASQVEGRPVDEVLPRLAPHMDAVVKAMKRAEPVSRFKLPFQDDSGETRQEDLLVFPLAYGGGHGAVIRLDDVTERARLDDLLVQTEKMMSVGGLAAGMAHEINNPLGGILQNAQVVSNRLSQDTPVNRAAAEEAGCSFESVRSFMERRGVLDMLAAIRASASRAARTVSHMLEFSRKSASGRQFEDISHLLDRAVDLSATDYDLKKKYDFKLIRIDREYDPELPCVSCTATEIEQVIMNLLRNAAQAMTGQSGQEPPRIVLRTRREGRFARIEVEDNGPGMDEATRTKVFEPFFSTKPTGEGTGLGLSVSYYIVTHNHSGTMRVESSPGNGAKFIVLLPIYPEDKSAFR